MSITNAATITLLLALGASAMPGTDETLRSRQDENDTQIAQIHAYNYTNCNPFDYDGFVWVYESQIPDGDCIVLSDFLDSNETVVSLATAEVAAGCTGEQPRCLLINFLIVSPIQQC